MRKLETLDCKYGAPMGRNSRDLEGNVGPVKLHLQHVRLDSGGYDEGGAYWGLRTYGEHLYWYWWSGRKPDAEKPLVISGFIDATDRAHAKVQIRKQYPQATFYR